MNDPEIFQIDLNKIIQQKAKSKKIPSFLIRGLSNLICQEKLNNFLQKNGSDTGVTTMHNAMDFFDIKVKLNGLKNIPDSGRFIFASNHPLGGLDGICLSAILGEKYNSNIRYLVNDILYFIRPLQSIFVPINKHGAQAKNGVQTINDAFSSDNQIITFPAGICSRKQKGIIEDPEWKKMFIQKAIESKRDIIPVYFEASNSPFFYRLANFRKAFRIKFNIEMLFLPREMVKAHGSTFHIYFGQPIPWKSFKDDRNFQLKAKEIKSIVYNLKKEASNHLH